MIVLSLSEIPPMPIDACCVMKDAEERYFYGSPNDGVLHWQIIELSDLCESGISRNDIKSLAVNENYWLSVALVFEQEGHLSY